MSSSPGEGPVRTRGQYKRYLRDSTAPIPRSTVWRLNKHTPTTADFSTFSVTDLSRQESSLQNPPSPTIVPVQVPGCSGSSPTSTSPGSPNSLSAADLWSPNSLSSLGSPPLSPMRLGSPNSLTGLDLGSQNSFSGLDPPPPSPTGLGSPISFSDVGSPNSISDPGSPSSLSGLDSSPPQLPSTDENPELLNHCILELKSHFVERCVP